MIWLRDNKGHESSDIITSNIVVVDNDKLSYLRSLKEKLSAKENYVLTYADERIGSRRIDPYYDGLSMYIENKHLGHNGNGAEGYIYLCKTYYNTMANSLLLLNEANKSSYDQKKTDIALLRMLKGDVLQVEIIQRLCDQLSEEDFRFLMNELWADFYFFATKVLDVVRFEQVEQYDTARLREISELCRSQNIENDSESILSNVDMAEQNTRVIRLAQTIKNKS